MIPKNCNWRVAADFRNAEASRVRYGLPRD